MNNWTIKYRLLFLAVLPLTVTVIILSVFFTASGLQQFELEHEMRGNAIVRQLAPASEYGVISENQQILSNIAESILSEDDVIAISIMDKRGDTLINISKHNDIAHDPSQTKTFSSPVYQSYLQISDYSPLNDENKRPEVIGKVSVTLSNASTISLQKRVLIENFSIAGFVLLITIFFTLRMANSLSRPLHHMSRAVSRISEGDLSYSPGTSAQGELGVLEQGIATMASRLHDAKEKERLQRERLEEINKDLETQIEQKKRIEHELRQTTLLANQANQAKSDFMGNMGHELRTPLNSIIGFTELLLMGDLDPKHRDYAQSVHNSCKDLLHLIRDILDFSKLEAGKLSVLPVAFDLRQAIEEVADAAALQCADKNVELVVNYAPEQPHNLLGDPGRIRQVIANLVTNAIKFVENGQIVIRAHVTETNNNQAQIHISVEDTGIGIPQDKLDTIFERFSQADSSSTRSYQGLGLGLTISKQLIELMGGSIHVASTFGEGSIFSIDFRLPINDYVSPDDNKLPHLSGKNVLIADGNAETLDALCQVLRYFGMRVDKATDGATALAAMHTANTENSPYQLAFIDSEMPGMDVENLNKAILHNNQLANTKLILLSPVNKLRERSNDWRTSSSAILTKPVRFHDLLDALQRVFSESERSAITLNNSGKALADSETSNSDKLLHSQRILVVDDNAMNLKVATSILKKLGYSADTAADGQQAIDMLDRSFYDIILMDILMPNMNGFEATRQIREMQKGSDQRSIIIALTAKALEGDREQCLEAGMDDYLSKPLQIQRLKEVLEHSCSENN
jgi:two-component system sensor histidine kinase BarA